MGDFSRVLVTIHSKDDDRFWEVIGHEKPGGWYQHHAVEGGVTYEIEQARCGWEAELRKAAEAGLRFYGEDLGLVGAWSPMVFASTNNKITSCCCMVDSGPVALVGEDGTVSEQDVRDAVDYYAALRAVVESMKGEDDG